MEHFLRFLSEKAKNTRNEHRNAESRNEHRNENLTAKLNNYELEIMKILKIEDITGDKLTSCVEVHKKWKNEENYEENSLFKKEGLD